ncbi:hypothetical protein Syn7502_02808 [Synechococcus sp. PCC 7502]|uniref:hypothetical protein n=1 Tax=Synechococcus sp. PCC 7502 TaxID=1173263 RepID=UPI00029FF814|nr:hypothetical protein [Synechococcus sp. PCC 7502]AFY74746.1 hypothetical protein Syn7502_02808 [Synechococcus sp. PCC 7502]
MKEAEKIVRKYCEVYMDCDGDKPYYIRFCPLETDFFRHGVSLGTRFENREDAEEFAIKVDEYINEFINIEIENVK